MTKTLNLGLAPYEPTVAAMQALKVDHALKDGTQMGPMANPRRPEAMERLIGDAKDQGAKLGTGGARIGNRGFFYQPSVLSEVPLEAQIMNEEPFGPVAVTRAFDSFDEVIGEANRLPFGRKR